MPARGQRSARTPVGDPGDRHSVEVHVGEYSEWMAVRGFSPRTIGPREASLRRLQRWLADRGVERTAEVTRPILERYQRHLFHYRKTNGQPLTFLTQRGRLTAVRQFFSWAAKTNRILYNPASELELPKVEHRLPKHVLTVGEVAQVMAQCDLGDRLGVRDRAVLEVFYATGIRRSELAGLRLYDLDFDRGALWVRQGKGRKDRVVPIGERALSWVDRYLSDVRPRHVVEPDDRWLFLTFDGQPISPAALTDRVRRYIATADIGKTGSCHLFRHTMATLMLERGADIRFIQQMLGHSELSTTQIYTRVSVTQLAAVHRATHPGATLDGPHRLTPVDNNNDDDGDDGDLTGFFLSLDQEQELENREHPGSAAAG